MKKLIFLAILAAFMLHGCADEQIAAPVDENIIETRASGNPITISPDYGDYLFTNVNYTFSGGYFGAIGGPTAQWYIIDENGNWMDYLLWSEPGGGASYTFTTPGDYTIKLVISGPGVFPTTYTKEVTVLGDLDIALTGPGTSTGVKQLFLEIDKYYTYTATPNFEYNGIFTWNVSPAPASSYYIYPNQLVVKFSAYGTYTITVSSGNPAVVTQKTVSVTQAILNI